MNIKMFPRNEKQTIVIPESYFDDDLYRVFSPWVKATHEAIHEIFLSLLSRLPSLATNPAFYRAGFVDQKGELLPNNFDLIDNEAAYTYGVSPFLLNRFTNFYQEEGLVWETGIGYTRAKLSDYHALILPPGEYKIDLTGIFNWEPGEFGDYGSCFFKDRTHVLRALEDHPDYFAFRFYHKHGGLGRCWVKYLSNEEFLVFNPYHQNGSRNGWQLLHFLRTFFDMDILLVGIITRGRGSDSFYINNDIGWLFYPRGKSPQHVVDACVELELDPEDYYEDYYDDDYDDYDDDDDYDNDDDYDVMGY